MINSQHIEHLSVVSVIFGFEDNKLKVLLIKRNVDIESNSWALPGGYIYIDEDIDKAAERILLKRTGVNIFMKQLGAFGKADRFPAKRIVTIAYYALVKPDEYTLSLENDAFDIQWVDVYKLPKLLLDHEHIIECAMTSLRQQIRIEPIGFNLLPNSFPLLTLQRLYEAILNMHFDKPNFRRKILKMKLLIPLDEKQEGVSYRNARLYKFDKETYDKLTKKGFTFEL
jgi:hypothetical protein